MAEHSSTLPKAPRGARVYGLRLLYRPGPRGRLLAATAVMATVAYALVSVRQVVTLAGVNRRFDFPEFLGAARALAHGADPYRAFLDGCPGFHWCLGGYIYPPLLAELLRPLAPLNPDDALRAWLVFSQLCLVLAAMVMWRATRGVVPPAALAVLVIATVAFRPLHYALYFGQVGPVLLLLLAVAAAAYMRTDRATASGAAVGVAAVLRVSPLLLLPALLRRPRALVAAAATGVGLLVSLWVLTPVTVEYFLAVLPRIGASTGVLDNQAPQGLLLRAGALWFLPSPPGVAVSAIIALAILGPSAWLAMRRDGDLRRRGAVMATFLAAMPLVSGLTWQHHLVSELVAYAALAPALLLPRMGAARWLAAASYPLMWLDRHYTDALAGTLGLDNPSNWRVAPFLLVTGLNLAGMVCLWVAALLALRRLDAGRAATVT